MSSLSKHARAAGAFSTAGLRATAAPSIGR